MPIVVVNVKVTDVSLVRLKLLQALLPGNVGDGGGSARAWATTALGAFELEMYGFELLHTLAI